MIYLVDFSGSRYIWPAKSKSLYCCKILGKVFIILGNFSLFLNLAKENPCSDLLMKPANQDIHLKIILNCEIVRCIIQFVYYVEYVY